MTLEPQKHVSHESGETLMAHGPHVLHEYLTTKLEAALGKALPQMELRFSNLSLSADIVVAEDDSSSSKSELPTLPNTIKKLFMSTKKNQVRKEILKNVSGAFRPGTITLLLGQPSSGKSSLLKILSGRFPVEKNITLEGDITYNGVPQQEIGKTLPQFTAYVDQRDKHFPVLTVKETLEFAHTFCGGELSRRGEELLSKGTAAENVAALEAARAMFEHYPDVIIQQLGLQNCQNTVVGDAMLRGVSGGERKRVTTGEMEFGMKYVTLMDEISTGLDSAATYDIINTQRSVAKMFRKTVVIALLQPSPEVFALFDDVMIMNEGEMMYHGPRDQVVDYFQDLGFVCPPGRDIADFLLDLGTKQQSMYEVDASNKRTKQTVPRYASEFAEVFRNSIIHAKTLQALDELHGPELLATVGDHMDFMPEFHQTFWDNTATLFHRQLLVQFRNIPFIAGRTVMIIIMGILYSTTFYKFDPTQVQVVMGVTFASVLFLSMGQFPQVPTFFPAREVFYKQRKANFYRTSSYVLANVASQIPIVIAETVMFGSLVYWLCGFTSSAANFLVFEAVLLLVNLVFSTWFFFIASASSDNNIATPLSMVSLIFFIMFSGFFILKSQIPDYFIWVYWINPLSWSLRALAVNQYRSSEFDVCEYGGIDYCAANNGQTMGEYYLGLFDTGSEKYWVPYAMIVMVVLYVFLIVLSYLVLEYKRYEAPQNVIVSKKDQSEPEDQYALAVTPKNNMGDLIAEEIAMEVEPRETNFTPVTLAFKDLRYTVPLPSNPKESIDLLKGITGYALPGTITALMGSSGAGKTTLMDVIASRKTGGQVQGEILLNGYQANDLTIRRSTGYCEQMDIHSDASTIREALTFSAFLRQDSAVPASTKFDSVNECLDLLDMHGIADQVIRGRSVEQMKRLTIGVELAAQPSVLFLDEPTSGLDARSAKLIMDGVRKVANTGRTVVCTIHQPSSEVFFLFDSLLLLKRGGETVYFGPLGDKCRNLIDYFEAIPGVAPIPAGYNPATWMLECIGAGVDNTASSSDTIETDFVQVFNNSEQKRLLEVTMARPGVTTPTPYSPELMFDNKRAANTVLQLQFVIDRFFKLYWRTPTYNLTRFGISVLLALLFGVIFVDADYATYQGLNSGVGMIFIVIVFKGFLSFTTAIPVMSKERPSFYRERASQTYNAFWYFMGATLVELPYVFSSSLIFTLIFFPMVGFTGFGTAVLFWLNLSLMILMQTYMGQLFAFLLPSEEVATIVGVLVINILFLFMGFSPPASTIPSGYKWLYDIAPLRFPLSIAAALVFADCPELPTFDEKLGKYVNVGSQLGCQPLANAPVNLGRMTVKEFTEGVFRMKHDNITSYFFVLIGFVIGFRILGALAIRYVNHQKK